MTASSRTARRPEKAAARARPTGDGTTGGARRPWSLVAGGHGQVIPTVQRPGKGP